MTLSKDIWSIIFKFSRIYDFLNIMLVEKTAYAGYKIHASPIFSFYGEYCEDYNAFLGTINPFCQMCDDTKEDELYIDINNVFESHNLSSPCCKNIICPNCVKNDGGRITCHYMFIESIVYIQEKEKEVCICCDDIQYKWLPCQKILNDKEIDKYIVVKKDYNSYSTKKIDHSLDFEEESLDCGSDCDHPTEYVDYTDVYAKCVCKNCGFICGARNYMDS